MWPTFRKQSSERFSEFSSRIIKFQNPKDFLLFSPSFSIPMSRCADWSFMGWLFIRPGGVTSPHPHSFVPVLYPLTRWSRRGNEKFSNPHPTWSTPLVWAIKNGYKFYVRFVLTFAKCCMKLKDKAKFNTFYTSSTRCSVFTRQLLVLSEC